MKHIKKPQHFVAGVTAPAARPTVLGAALLATLVTCPIATAVFLVQLVL